MLKGKYFLSQRSFQYGRLNNLTNCYNLNFFFRLRCQKRNFKMIVSNVTSAVRACNNLLQPIGIFHTWRYLSNKSAIVTKIHRKLYLKQYPTTMVQPDGSTFTFRHFEPRRIVKLPLDLSTLTEEEKAVHLEKRKPKKKIVIEEDIEDNFNSKSYIKYMKRK